MYNEITSELTQFSNKSYIIFDMISISWEKVTFWLEYFLEWGYDNRWQILHEVMI